MGEPRKPLSRPAAGRPEGLALTSALRVFASRPWSGSPARGSQLPFQVLTDGSAAVELTEANDEGMRFFWDRSARAFVGCVCYSSQAAQGAINLGA